jgi:signal transduction histidine kinase
MERRHKVFSIDARTILTLGRDSIKDHTTAVLELVKNSYDADASLVEIKIMSNSEPRFISIVDNGCGMSEIQVEKYWLRIGYSEKRVDKTSRLKRRKTGEKGIGRISSDRLGAILELYTKAENFEPYALRVNWDDFNVDGKELSSVPVEIIGKAKLRSPKLESNKLTTGTELIISGLRQNWTKKDIANLYEELSILTPPFKKVRDFEIILKTDVEQAFSGKIESPFYQTAEIALEAKFDGKSTISYSVTDRDSSELPIANSKIEWGNLIHKDQTSTDEEISPVPKIGPLVVNLLFYPRKAETVEGTDFRLSDLREFLDKNAGVKIYRDNVRVKPYGNPQDPEGDWLGLGERKAREPAGIARPGWRVAPNQIVGAVFVGRDNNKNLYDSSSREGLIKGESFNDLRALVLGCVSLLETFRHEKVKTKKPEQEVKVSPKEDIEDLSRALKTLKSDLKSIKYQMPKTSQRPVLRTLDQVTLVDERIRDTTKSIEELVSQSRVFRGLATIGIAAAVFGHETQSSISEFIGATYTASNILIKSPTKIDLAIDELQKAQKYANQVSAWGAFALARVQRDKRLKRKLNIKKILEGTIKDIEPVFTAASIKIIKDFETIEGRSYAMDIEALLLNLLTNAYTACLQVKRERIIRVEIQSKKKNKTPVLELVVSDTGPGVDSKLMNRIWDPLFSTKMDKEGKQIGTGLGLSIVGSIVQDLKGYRVVNSDPKLKGAQFVIGIPLN